MSTLPSITPLNDPSLLASLGVASNKPASVDDSAELTENEKQELGIITPPHRVRRVLSETAVNHEQTLKIMALEKKIDGLPNHLIAATIEGNLAQFREQNKKSHPESEKLHKQMDDLRKQDKATPEYKKINDEKLEISKTKHRFSAGVPIIGAILADNIIRRCFELALLHSKNNKVTVDDFLGTADYMKLDVWVFFRDGKNFDAFKSKYDYEQAKKLREELLNRATKDFKGIKTEEEIKQIADKITLIDINEPAGEQEDDKESEFLTYKNFLTYVSQICKECCAAYHKEKNTPETMQSMKIEKNLKIILSYICIDSLEGLSRAIGAFAEDSKTRTLSSDEFQKIISIILNHSNINGTDDILKMLAVGLDKFEKLEKQKKANAEKRAEAKLTEEQRLAAEQKEKLAEEQKKKKAEIRKEMKEKEKQAIASLVAVPK